MSEWTIFLNMDMYVYTMGYFLNYKKNEILSFVAIKYKTRKQYNVLSKKSQAEEDKCFMFSLIWGG